MELWSHSWVSCFGFSPPCLQAPVLMPSLHVSGFPCTAWPFSPELSAGSAAQLTPALPCTPALCLSGFAICLRSCFVSSQSPGFPFSVCYFMRCIRMSPKLLLQKGRAPIPRPGSSLHSTALPQLSGYLSHSSCEPT